MCVWLNEYAIWSTTISMIRHIVDCSSTSTCEAHDQVDHVFHSCPEARCTPPGGREKMHVQNRHVTEFSWISPPAAALVGLWAVLVHILLLLFVDCDWYCLASGFSIIFTYRSCEKCTDNWMQTVEISMIYFLSSYIHENKTIASIVQ